MASYGKNRNSSTIPTPSKRVHLGEVNKRIFEEINKIDLETTSMSFNTLLNYIYIYKETYINAL
jgi:hypothetical protein